jgi:hypothetical protein
MHARCIIFSGSCGSVHPCIFWVLLAASSSMAVLLAEGFAAAVVYDSYGMTLLQVTIAQLLMFHTPSRKLSLLDKQLFKAAVAV